MKKIKFLAGIRDYFISPRGKLTSVTKKGKEKVLKGTDNRRGGGPVDMLPMKRKGPTQISRARLLFATYTETPLSRIKNKQIVRKDGAPYKVGQSWTSLEAKTYKQAAKSSYQFRTKKKRK